MKYNHIMKNCAKVKYKTPTIKEITGLLIYLKKNIRDDYRAFDDEENDKPSMQVTIGASIDGSWGYQTGDNSYTGGAYEHKFWGVRALFRNSNCRELALDVLNEIEEQMATSLCD